MPLTIPTNAPFSGPQKMWLKGFLDGINSAIAPGTTTPAATTATAPAGIPVTIAWGSQTGTAESLAKKLAKTLTSQGHQPAIKDMADLTPGDLTGISHLLVITSTYGEGDAPDNAAALHSALHAGDAPSLSSLSYSVLALGDSNYAEFCKCGHDFDQRLAALGAKRLTPIVECDVDVDEPYAAWLKQLESTLSPA